ncbi:MAG: hypothetical protein M3R53_03545 [Candidatus Eremiobacteraeota bacterium]|nr:hypothetical protein [Candidatus Eremiobacteraeota bacterium]
MTIELFGMARHVAGTPAIEVGGERLTPRELVRALAAIPQMAGAVVDAEREEFVEPNMLLLDGRRVCGADEPFYAADRPCVLFLASGG